MNPQENLWDEQGMADLVGLQLSEPAENPDMEPVPATEPENSIQASEPLLDPEDLEESLTSGNKRGRSLSLAANPFTKLGVVAAGTGLVIGILAVFTNSIMNDEAPQPPEDAQADFSDPMVEEAEEISPEGDRGQILTDLAMGRQQAELEALAGATEQPKPEPTAPGEPQFSPAAPTVSRPAQSVQRPISAPAPRVSAPAAPRLSRPPTTSPRSASPSPETNPMEQWMALAHVGSYGRSATTPEEAPTLPVEAVPTNAPVQLARTNPSTPPAINHAEEAAILIGQSIESPNQSPILITGTQAPAVLITPLIWVETTESENLQFIVRLTEPLLTPEDEIGLPAETQLVVQVKSVNESGLAQLAVMALIQDGQEVALPEDVFHIRGKEGTPLIAQKYGDPGPAIANQDFNSAVISGLARAAELINQPKSSTVITSAGGSTVTQDNGDTDILAGVLEGAFDQLTQQMTQRNQAALEEILSRPTVWHLPPDTEIEVFINRTVAL